MVKFVIGGVNIYKWINYVYLMIKRGIKNIIGVCRKHNRKMTCYTRRCAIGN